jgi:hypothetical protein
LFSNALSLCSSLNVHTFARWDYIKCGITKHQYMRLLTWLQFPVQLCSWGGYKTLSVGAVTPLPQPMSHCKEEVCSNLPFQHSIKRKQKF